MCVGAITVSRMQGGEQVEFHTCCAARQKTVLIYHLRHCNRKRCLDHALTKRHQITYSRPPRPICRKIHICEHVIYS